VLEAVELEAGENRVEATLDLALFTEEVAVTGDVASVSSGSIVSLTAEEIAALPDDPEELEQVLLEMAGPGAVLRVNGFSGGRLPDKSQIREVRFHMNPMAAEHHESAFVRIEIVTKPATALAQVAAHRTA